MKKLIRTLLIMLLVFALVIPSNVFAEDDSKGEMTTFTNSEAETNGEEDEKKSEYTYYNFDFKYYFTVDESYKDSIASLGNGNVILQIDPEFYISIKSTDYYSKHDDEFYDRDSCDITSELFNDTFNNEEYMMSYFESMLTSYSFTTVFESLTKEEINGNTVWHAVYNIEEYENGKINIYLSIINGYMYTILSKDTDEVDNTEFLNSFISTFSTGYQYNDWVKKAYIIIAALVFIVAVVALLLLRRKRIVLYKNGEKYIVNYSGRKLNKLLENIDTDKYISDQPVIAQVTPVTPTVVEIADETDDIEDIDIIDESIDKTITEDVIDTEGSDLDEPAVIEDVVADEIEDISIEETKVEEAIVDDETDIVDLEAIETEPEDITTEPVEVESEVIEADKEATNDNEDSSDNETVTVEEISEEDTTEAIYVEETSSETAEDIQIDNNPVTEDSNTPSENVEEAIVTDEAEKVSNEPITEAKPKKKKKNRKKNKKDKNAEQTPVVEETAEIVEAYEVSEAVDTNVVINTDVSTEDVTEEVIEQVKETKEVLEDVSEAVIEVSDLVVDTTDANKVEEESEPVETIVTEETIVEESIPVETVEEVVNEDHSEASAESTQVDNMAKFKDDFIIQSIPEQYNEIYSYIRKEERKIERNNRFNEKRALKELDKKSKK